MEKETTEKLFTQQEVDEIVRKRLERMGKKHAETIRTLIKALTNAESSEE